MQKWEYCTLGPIEYSSTSWKWIPNEPVRIVFTNKGAKEEGFKLKRREFTQGRAGRGGGCACQAG